MEVSDRAKEAFERMQKEAFERMQKVIKGQVDAPQDNAQQKLAILAGSYACLQRAPGYATLNYELSLALDSVGTSVQAYVENRMLTRPLNFLVLAAPGSGKSQLVKSIKTQIGDDKVGFVPFNMATMTSTDDLAHALDAARNVVIEGKLPLVFLDEFDCDEDNYSLLLPVLWDGELHVGGRTLKLVRCVFFLAGSRPTLSKDLREARDLDQSAGRERKDSKLVDLFSRINGQVIEIPTFVSGKVNAQAEKVMIAMTLLRHRFKACTAVPWGLLRFMAEVTYRYETRSMATLVDLLALRIGATDAPLKQISLEHLKLLPLSTEGALQESPLAFHLLDPFAEAGIVRLWSRSIASDFPQPIREERLDKWKGQDEKDRRELLQYADNLSDPSKKGINVVS